MSRESRRRWFLGKKSIYIYINNTRSFSLKARIFQESLFVIPCESGTGRLRGWLITFVRVAANRVINRAIRAGGDTRVNMNGRKTRTSIFPLNYIECARQFFEKSPNLIRTFPQEWGNSGFANVRFSRPRGFVKPGFFKGYRFSRTTWRKLNFSEECPRKMRTRRLLPETKVLRGEEGKDAARSLSVLRRNEFKIPFTERNLTRTGQGTDRPARPAGKVGIIKISDFWAVDTWHDDSYSNRENKNLISWGFTTEFLPDTSGDAIQVQSSRMIFPDEAHPRNTLFEIYPSEKSSRYILRSYIIIIALVYAF